MKDPTNTIHVLFLCTGNSARSIMAEAILNKVGAPRFSAFSAGSRPVGIVNPMTIELLDSLHYSTHTLRSKSWLEFSYLNSPKFGIIITVCDSAAAEACPTWPGHPIRTHWSLSDPAGIQGSHEERLKAFADVYQKLEEQIQHLIQLPVWPVGEDVLKKHLHDIEQETISGNWDKR